MGVICGWVEKNHSAAMVPYLRHKHLLVVGWAVLSSLLLLTEQVCGVDNIA